MADIPADGDVLTNPGSFEEFSTRALAGPRYIPEATFVAVTEDGEVVGYAQLGWMNRAAGIADHLMLAVHRGWRGRGIAKALKACPSTWALDNGLSELRTGNGPREQCIGPSGQCALPVHAAPRATRLSRPARR